VGKYLSGVQHTAQGKTELIVMVKTETRHPVDRPFASDFPAICNHCGVITAWSRKTRKFWAICAFFWKNDQYGNIFKILFRTFSPPHRSMLLCSNVVKIIPTRNRQNRALVTGRKNFGCLSNCYYGTDHAQNLPRPAPQHLDHIVPDFIQIISLSAEL